MRKANFSMGLIFIGVLLGSCLFSVPDNSSEVWGDTISQGERHVQKIPVKDRAVLEKFFRRLLFFSEFAYTLFGDKPVSVEEFDLDNGGKPKLFPCSAHGCKTWEKYASLFPQQEYLFLFDEDIGTGICEITLINRRAFQQVVDKHREKFIGVFGSDISSEKLLGLLVQKKSLWNTALKNRDDLLGILLGYGESNALLFQKRREILGDGIRRRVSPSAGHCSIAAEIDSLNTSLQPFSDEGRISVYFMRLPGFVAEGSCSETKQLKRKYRSQRKRITQRYARSNALEITLERLCLKLED